MTHSKTIFIKSIHSSIAVYTTDNDSMVVLNDWAGNSETIVMPAGENLRTFLINLQEQVDFNTYTSVYILVNHGDKHPFNIESVHGSIFVSDIDNVNVETVHGNVILQDINHSTIKTVHGDIFLNNCNYGSIETTHGSVVMNLCSEIITSMVHGNPTYLSIPDLRITTNTEFQLPSTEDKLMLEKDSWV